MSLNRPEALTVTELTTSPQLSPIPMTELWAEVDGMLNKQL
jgi:hypothetical protein